MKKTTQPATTTTDIDFTRAEIARHELPHVEKKTIALCQAAIDSMRRFLADAQRDVDVCAQNLAKSDEIAKLPRRVLHHLTWGNANANGEIETAMDYAQEIVQHAETLRASEAGK